MKEMIKKYSGTLICSVLVMLAGVLVGFTCTQSIYTHASCHSITQLDSRHFFQIGALPGQRRRGDMKLLRRPCNILPRAITRKSFSARSSILIPSARFSPVDGTDQICDHRSDQSSSQYVRRKMYADIQS